MESRFKMRRALILISLLAALVLAACGTAAGPSPAPTGTPRPDPTAQPSPSPVTDPSPGLVLDVAGDWDVTAVITDRTGKLASAKSGVGTATMTVRWFDSKVSNVDGSTLEVIWVGLPRDEEVAIAVFEAGGKLVIEIDQAAPPLNSDAEGSDRVLVLEFDAPVRAGDVEVRFKGIAA